MSTTVNPWDIVLELLHREVSDYQYITWFKPMKPVMQHPDHMLIWVENAFIASLLTQRHLQRIQNAVALAYGREIRIEFRFENEESASVRPEQKHIPDLPFWDKVLKILRSEVSEYQYAAWFKSMKAVMKDPDHLLILVEDAFVASLMTRRYAQNVKNAVSLACGREIQIDFAPASDQ